LYIYFRACEKQQAISNLLRFKDINKTEILKRCWSSIQRSVSDEDTIIVIHDEVSENTLQWLNSTAKTTNISFIEVPPHEWGYHLHTIVLFDTLEIKSKEFPDELHYIVEDDYLHTSDAITVLKQNLINWPNFATSYDYPDRYARDGIEQAIILLGTDRHWRTVSSSTMTVIAKGATWLRYIEKIKTVADVSNDAIFTEIYKETVCISPLPGVSSHMTDRHMTPLVDWDMIWSNINT
jgi:hypothetical protein